MKNSEKDCSLCKANFDAWLGSLDLETEVDKSMKKTYRTFCPVCRYSRNKSRKK